MRKLLGWIVVAAAVYYGYQYLVAKGTIAPISTQPIKPIPAGTPPSQLGGSLNPFVTDVGSPPQHYRPAVPGSGSSH
jgi:hypothetical protein